ncbi:MAG: GAF domain-containing protein, partial [Mycobacterium sp.]
MVINETLREAVDGRRGLAAADSLCVACVTLFDIDAAAISLIFAGVSSGTLGSSDAAARVYDELQFTIGEGPCLDSVSTRTPVLVADLATRDQVRWPLYRPAMLDHKIRGIFAIPVVVAGEYVG